MFLAKIWLKRFKAQAQGADYIGFGSVFETKTKPGRQAMDLDLLQKVIKQVKIPVFPIGGISRGNIGQLIPLGVTRVAVCRDILLASRSVSGNQGIKKIALSCKRGGNSVVEFQLPKLTTRVRFPSPAPYKGRDVLVVSDIKVLKILLFVSFLGFLTGCATTEI